MSEWNTHFQCILNGVVDATNAATAAATVVVSVIVLFFIHLLSTYCRNYTHSLSLWVCMPTDITLI